MTALLSLFRRSRRGVAAVEFALTLPIMLLFFGGAVDFGLANYAQGCVASAVAAGAEYATLTGASVTSANVRTLVQHASSLTTMSVTATGPACYCAAGTTSPTASSTPASSSPCPSSGGANPCGGTCTAGGVSGIYGTFVVINASYTYNGILPMYSRLTSATMSQVAIAPIQCS